MVFPRAVVFVSTVMAALSVLATEAPRLAPLDRVQAATQDVERLLAKHPQVAAGWRKYLKLDALHAELQNGERASSDTIAAVHGQLRQRGTGMEHEEFRKLELALEDWRRALDAGFLSGVWQEAEAEAAAFKPVTDMQLKVSRKAAADAVSAFRTRLAGVSSADAWKKSLKLAELEARLKTKETPLLDARARAMWLESLRTWNEPTLSAAYSALRHDDQLRLSLAAGDTAATCRQRLTTLHSAVNAHVQHPTVQTFAPMVQAASELEARGHAKKLTQSLRREFSRPNLILQASAEFIEKQTRSDLNERFDVNDTILGTPVEGAGQLQGQAYLKLVPYDSAAGFDLHLEADMTSDTTSSTRGVDVITQGTARLHGRKRLLFDGQGMRLFPSQVNADLDVSLVDVHGGPVKRRVAMSMYEQQREQARLESKDRAERRVAEKMDEGLNDVQRRMSSGPAKRYMEPLFVRQTNVARHWRTTKDALEGRFWSADPHEFGSPTPPPLDVAQRGVTLQMHETFLERMLRKQLSGRTLSQDQLAAESDTWFMRGGGAAPQRGSVDWNVSFAELPAKVDVVGDELRLVLYCTEFSSEKGVFPGMQIGVNYDIACRDQRLVLERRDAVSIMPLDYKPGDDVQFSGRQQVLRSVMRRAFEKQFPTEVALAGFEPSPENGLKQPLAFRQALAKDGWLAVVLEPKTEAQTAAR